MNFKNWLEDYGGMYPEEGDFIDIGEKKVRDHTTQFIPGGKYFILKFDSEKYTLKKLGTNDMYLIHAEDLDQDIKDKNAVVRTWIFYSYFVPCYLVMSYEW